MRRHLSITVAFLLISVLGVAAAAGAQEAPTDTVHFVIDVSGSMGGTPLADAKAALTEAIAAQPDSNAIGLRSYAGSCGNGGVLRVPIGVDNRDALTTAITQLSAGGGTPTDAALRAAVDDLPETGSRTIVLISDGQSGCSDPCTVAAELVASEGVDFDVHTVGWNSGGSNAAEMQCIADATGGQYFETDDVDGLVDAIGSVTNSCSDHAHFVGVKGSGEGSEYGGLGKMVGELETTFRTDVESAGFTVTTHAVDYAAPPVEVAFVDLGEYLRASQQGGEFLAAHVNEYAAACPGSPVALAGYSSGALVVRIAMSSLTPDAANQVAAVQLIADPARETRTQYLALGTADPTHTGVFVWSGATLPINTLISPVISWCNEGDLVCDPSWKVTRILAAGAFAGPAGSKLFAKVVMKDGGPIATHTQSYLDFGDIDAAGHQAARPTIRVLEGDN